jgi:hypothetical protein
MSKDKVEFELRLSCSERVKLEVPFRNAFGVCLPNPESGYLKDGDSLSRFIKIQCRPSQFARFLIYRDEAGCQNRFKELGAKLIKGEVNPVIIDVSKNKT